MLLTTIVCGSRLVAGPVLYTFVSLEGRSHFDTSLCDCPSAAGTGNAALTYQTTGLGGVGTYSGSASAASSPGALSVSGDFQINNLPVGSNISLI
jgi:hypothetical protein